ncbi:unnamed protein product [Protopolystoma xenopodis]|uniref:Pre-mRNA-splicing factor Syf1/CRNKL1-like C-terminal HAT-repeats domain-containing protein n=1 Tax=Protopolystoma xenopodis TaxID=117903 RepID=A0A448XKS7_9PLAT|nr:unnamed protein product [Protopolystoma xenopodis]
MYAEMESLLGELDRARGIYELGVSQRLLDMPELLWKAYIDFELEQRDWEHARALYRRLMQRTQHVKVWLSLASFELCAQDVLPEPTAAQESQETEEDMDEETGLTRAEVRARNELAAANAVERARDVYREANKALRTVIDKEHRVKLIEAWKEFEVKSGFHCVLMKREFRLLTTYQKHPYDRKHEFIYIDYGLIKSLYS